jgi:glutamate dehydrogenase/leucine dehydrogenase
VAGSANNQLATPEDAGRLRDLGILYAPDFVLSMGGAMAITGMEAFGWTREEADEQVAEAITSTLRQILDVAEREEITTVAAARRIADERLGQSQRHRLGHRRG